MVALNVNDTPLKPKKKFSFSVDKKKALQIARIAMVISLLLAVGLVALGVRDFIVLNEKSSTLADLSYYNVQVLKTNNFTKEAMQNVTDIKNVITLQQDALSEKESSIAYFTKLQTPYEYFLQYILFPSMNIRKDRYANTIDTTIIGQSYLQKNPYMDNNLISHWTDFFRDIGKNTQYNEINDISIGKLTENLNGSFTLPINVSFSSSNKRSFLMLVDKLSITSNRGNISLINELLYNLWDQVEKDMTAELSGSADKNQAIGKGMYDWLYGTNATHFITETEVDKAVMQTVECSDANQDFCYFKFREKFRSIPLLAYTL